MKSFIFIVSLCLISFSIFASSNDRDLNEKVKDTGGKRADSDAPIWQIDVENDMHYCYRTKADLAFWRSSEEDTEILIIEAQQAGLSKVHRWLADSGQTINWLSELPISEQETYLIKMGEVIEHQLVLHHTAANIKQMRQHHCHRQADLLEKIL